MRQTRGKVHQVLNHAPQPPTKNRLGERHPLFGRQSLVLSNAAWPHSRSMLYATSPSDSIRALVANFPLGSRSRSRSVLISE